MDKKNGTKGAAPTVKDAECPRCERLLSAPNITPQSDRYDRNIRKCSGWCEDCEAGYQMIQFEYYGRWNTSEYLIYHYVDGKSVPYGGWNKVVDLPNPPLVVTGPGGEYDKLMSLKEMEALLDKQGQQAMGIIQQLVGAVLDGKKRLKELKAQKNK